MIPYEDLVIALQSWRAKQGLPVAQLSGALIAPPAASAPPAPPRPQPFLGNVATPPPLAAPAHDDVHDVDEAALLEDHYEAEGNDFAMAFAAGPGDDSTSIGGPPPLGRPSESALDDGADDAPPAPGSGKTRTRNDDW
ncbi:MAG: hypothetical protein H0T46_26460 [Deltaproteobacteria bacterium]|nr:hypothetical protein [Deltaproteobacteria bacterium]